MRTPSRWPKTPPTLTEEQSRAREAFTLLWHERLPEQYSIIETFNQGFPARLPTPVGSKTLEVGAGIGGHLPFEDLGNQEYHALEMRPEWCDVLRTKLAPSRVTCGNIEEAQDYESGYFDRVIAIHVLEHIRNLPLALDEIWRILKPGGSFDVVLPCEGGFAYSLARKISAERLFEQTFGMDYTPIIRNEHVNTLAEIKPLLADRFTMRSREHFPLRIPLDAINLVVGYRYLRPSAAGC